MGKQLAVLAILAWTTLTLSVAADKPSELGGEAALVAQSTPLPVKVDTAAAMRHIRYLSGTLGPRPAGSQAERNAGDYIAKSLKASGCSVSYQKVGLPFGRTSRNIIGLKKGTPETLRRVIIGAHYDSRRVSPGANDNASGTALMLELARIVPEGRLPFNILFIGFGAEEIIEGTGGNHHFGSRQFAAARSDTEMRNMIAMFSLDMVGAGANLQIGNCGTRNRTLINQLRYFAKQAGAGSVYFLNCGSDHEAFEKRGIQVAHVRWHPDPHYHRPTDTYDKIKPNKIQLTGSMVLRWLNHMGRTSN